MSVTAFEPVTRLVNRMVSHHISNCISAESPSVVVPTRRLSTISHCLARAPSLALPVFIPGLLWAPVNTGALRKVVLATPLGLIQHISTRCNGVAPRYGTANIWAIVANPPPH